jgi:nifR3 family TIM-barrel protein
MAGYTDAAFRSVCIEWGASLCFTEMVSAEALTRGSAKTYRLLESAENEVFKGIQIFAAEPRLAGAATRIIDRLAPSIIDLNCGCSVPKVLKTGSGAALIRNPERIAELVSAMRQETEIPISVKLRSGWDESEITYLECAEAAVKAGAVLLCLHPRTRAQGFAGKARWEEIAALKRACPVPVFGSGDLFKPEDCAAMLERTKCDGVMIARGALGNPFIFQRTRELLDGSDTAGPIEPADRLETALRHMWLLIQAKGEKTACREMRKHFVTYTRGMEGGAALRQSVVMAETAAEYEGIVAKYLGPVG